MEAELSATRYAEVPVADLAGLNTQLTSCYFAATPDSTRSCNASGPTTRPGEEDPSDLMYRRTEENSQPMTSVILLILGGIGDTAGETVCRVAGHRSALR